MKLPFNRIMTTALACFLAAGLAVAGCGGEGGGESGGHGGEAAESEEPDPNTEARQEHMREIARLCEGIAMAVENGSVGTITADVTHLKEIMEEVSTMPPRYDSSRYGFYASDFQIRAETLIGRRGDRLRHRGRLRDASPHDHLRRLPLQLQVPGRSIKPADP